MDPIPNTTTIPPFVSKAGAPFDRPDADVVLRSEDGVDFRTFKAHLSSASEFLDHMFSSLQPPSADDEDELSDGLPIVPFYDPSPILRALLCYCVPGIDSRSSSVPLIDIQNLAIKYDMVSVAKAVYKDRIRLERELPPSSMLDVIWQKVGQDEDMYLAAAHIFTASANEEEEMVELGLVSKERLAYLKRYQKLCCDAAVRVASPPHGHYRWMDSTYHWFQPVGHSLDCYRAGITNIFMGYIHERTTRDWWWLYMSKAKSRLAKRPWGSTVTSGDFFDKALQEASRCDVCGKDLKRDFGRFTEQFARQIDSAVSYARFRISSSGNVTNFKFTVHPGWSLSLGISTVILFNLLGILFPTVLCPSFLSDLFAL